MAIIQVIERSVKKTQTKIFDKVRYGQYCGIDWGIESVKYYSELCEIIDSRFNYVFRNMRTEHFTQMLDYGIRFIINCGKYNIYSTNSSIVKKRFEKLFRSKGLLVNVSITGILVSENSLEVKVERRE
ncbi:MAG: hypothetical protein JSW06_02900 [Thermoplasmatales archaeon]|nr:MAG: hypothetical protein JSW06_02900 [Thermoplasmatales archaeon]